MSSIARFPSVFKVSKFSCADKEVRCDCISSEPLLACLLPRVVKSTCVLGCIRVVCLVILLTFVYLFKMRAIAVCAVLAVALCAHGLHVDRVKENPSMQDIVEISKNAETLGCVVEVIVVVISCGQ